MQNNVLITGADGFIGSHLVEALVENGYNVRAFVYYNSFNSYGWLDTISKVIKSKIEFFELPQDDPKQRKPDISKAKTILNWYPRVNLEEGLDLTVSEFKTRI